MTFSQMKEQIESDDAASWTLEYFHKEYFKSDRALTLEELRDKCLLHLFKDLSDLEPPFEFKMHLKEDYSECELSASDCLRVAIFKKHLFHRDVKTWTEHALKVFDPFLIRYIQDVKNESISIQGNWLKETLVYEHLINNGGIDKQIGENFKYVYQHRSQLYHVCYLNRDGKVIIKKMSRKKLNNIKDDIFRFLKDALSCFQVFYKIQVA